MKYLNKNTFLGALLSLFIVSIITLLSARNTYDANGWAGNLSELPKETAKYFRDDPDLFDQKTKAGPSDWLAQHKETGQTFKQYLAARPNLPNVTRKKLYVLPLGGFNEDAPSIDALETYMKAYYLPMEVEILPAVRSTEVVAKKRQNNGVTQWKSGDIINWMKGKLPADAYAMLAVTMTDLYPDEKWNFVFGQASFKQRVGVFSFARYGSEDRSVALMRAAKVLSHEMGHMFGIKHCTFYQCNMNGANPVSYTHLTLPTICSV